MIVQLKADNKNIVFLDGSEEINANDDFVQSLIVLLETPLNANERISVVFFNEESVTYELDMLVRNRQNDSCIVDIPQALINSGGAWNLKLLRHRQAYTGEKTTASNEYPFTVGAGVKNINGENVTTAELQTAYNEIMQTRDEAQSLANTAGAAAASAQSAAETARQSSLGASSAANYAETKATQATTAASEAAQSADDAEQSRATAAQILSTTDKLKSQAEKAASDADDAVNYINTTLRDVSKAKAFDDYGALVNHLLTAQLDIPYAIGQPFYLIATSVPDLWVSGVLADYEPYEYTTPEKFLADMDANGGKVRVGNYQLSKLETAKITIDNAQEKYDENLETEDKTVVGAINETNSKALATIESSIADGTYSVKLVFQNAKGESIAETTLDLPLSEFVKFTDKAGFGRYGVVCGESWGDVTINNNGNVYAQHATQADIINRYRHRLLHCNNVDLITKVGITTNTETLTDEEKASACEWVGAMRAVPAFNDSPSLVVINKEGITSRQRFTSTPASYAIPIANGAGNIKTNEPQEDLDCANKKYVDDNIPVLTRISTGTSTEVGSAYVTCKKSDVVSSYNGVLAYLRKIGATAQHLGIPFAIGSGVQSLWAEPDAPILHIGTQDVGKTPTWEIVDA